MIIGHTFAALVAATLRDDTWLATRTTSTPTDKPIILTAGSYQRLQQQLGPIDVNAIYDLELSSYGEWGTLDINDTRPLGYSISSQLLYQILIDKAPKPKIVNTATLKESIMEANHSHEPIVFADGQNSMADQVANWKTQNGPSTTSYIVSCRLSKPCKFSMQRYTGQGIYAWIPQSPTTGMCVLTTQNALYDDWTSSLSDIWHGRLCFQDISKSTKHSCSAYIHQPFQNSPSHYFRVGSASMMMAPILARGLNTVIQQCVAINSQRYDTVHSIAQDAYRSTQRLLSLTSIPLPKGLALNALQQYHIDQYLIPWGTQHNMDHQPCKTS